jgi:hypothetical protein
VSAASGDDWALDAGGVTVPQPYSRAPGPRNTRLINAAEAWLRHIVGLCLTAREVGSFVRSGEVK